MLALAVWRASALRFSVLALLLLPGAARSLAAPPVPAPAPYVYVPRASIVGVERSFSNPGTAPMPGAGVRAFQDPDAQTGGSERFEIRWFANPPGIPPGVVLLLETVQERSAMVKNHVRQFNEKSEGHLRAVIEIPPAQIRQAGRILKWRVRVIWRGRLLASQSSDNWDG